MLLVAYCYRNWNKLHLLMTNNNLLGENSPADVALPVAYRPICRPMLDDISGQIQDLERGGAPALHIKIHSLSQFQRCFRIPKFQEGVHIFPQHRDKLAQHFAVKNSYIQRIWLVSFMHWAMAEHLSFSFDEWDIEIGFCNELSWKNSTLNSLWF
jgi:hypothetical protein